MYLHILFFPKTEMVQVVEIIPCSSKDSLSSIYNNMAADILDLVTQVARVSAAMVLTWLSWIFF